jgi:hypothetical protein
MANTVRWTVSALPYHQHAVLHDAIVDEHEHQVRLWAGFAVHHDPPLVLIAVA